MLQYFRINDKFEIVEVFPYNPFDWIRDSNFLKKCHMKDCDIEIKQHMYYINGEILDGSSYGRELEIKTELQNLDSTINRATEDLYVLTNTTPYEKTAEVIQQKEALRQELQTLQGV